MGCMCGWGGIAAILSHSRDDQQNGIRFSGTKIKVTNFLWWECVILECTIEKGTPLSFEK